MNRLNKDIIDEVYRHLHAFNLNLLNKEYSETFEVHPMGNLLMTTDSVFAKFYNFRPICQYPLFENLDIYNQRSKQVGYLSHRYSYTSGSGLFKYSSANFLKNTGEHWRSNFYIKPSIDQVLVCFPRQFRSELKNCCLKRPKLFNAIGNDGNNNNNNNDDNTSPNDTKTKSLEFENLMRSLPGSPELKLYVLQNFIMGKTVEFANNNIDSLNFFDFNSNDLNRESDKLISRINDEIN